jgi:Winged helix DNA-binding domain
MVDPVRGARLAAQRLEPRCADGAAAVARAVCGLQAQDARAAALSVRARSVGLTEADVAGDAGLVRTWAWRGTLHALAAEDVGWVLPLVAPGALRGSAARWRQLGLDEPTYESARGAIVDALASGPRTRSELREALAAAGVDAHGQRLPHLVRRVAFEGLLQHPLDDTFAALETTLVPREEALAKLAGRYLAAFGPADPRDLAKWSGLPAADVRRAWEAAGDASGARAGEAAERGRTAGGASATGAGGPVVRLLPAFDTYLLGYADRSETVPPEHLARVWPGGGWLHPVVLVDGLAAGTWRIERGDVAVEPFGDVPRGLDEEIGDVRRFLGLV